MSRSKPTPASPKVPVTNSCSPARALVRSNACPSGADPITVTVIVNGPRVVSPPTNGRPSAWLAAASPVENPCNQRESLDGKVKANVMASGVAPIAARSLAAVATARNPRSSGSSSSVKWRPSTRVSVDTRRLSPGGTRSAAASSPTDNATPSPPPSAEKYWRIMSNSLMPISAIRARSVGV